MTHGAYGRPLVRAELAESTGELRDCLGELRENQLQRALLPSTTLQSITYSTALANPDALFGILQSKQ